MTRKLTHEVHMISTRSTLVLVPILAWFGFAASLNAQIIEKPKNYKAIIRHVVTLPNASATAHLEANGVKTLQDYDGFRLALVPDAAKELISALANSLGVTVELHDEYDRLELPGGQLSLGGSLPKDLAGLGLANEVPGQFGIYVIQYIGPIRAEWAAAVTSIGAIPLESVNFNGSLVAATPAIAARLRESPFLQTVEPYHPFLKSAAAAWAGVEQSLVIRLADAPGSREAAKRIRSLTVRDDFTDAYGGFPYVVGTYDLLTALQVVREPLVLSVAAYPSERSSDERAIMTLTSNVATTGGNLQPTGPGTYFTWLTATGRCIFCSTLDADGFRVGIADSGLDSGICGSQPSDPRCPTPPDPSIPPLHADFTNTARVHFGTNFVPVVNGCNPNTSPPCDPTTLCNMCDGNYHGTMVAGVAAGAGGPGLGTIDSHNFYLGQGVAPTAGIVVTKVSNFFGQVAVSTIYDWATDALANGAHIQNHSRNSYSQSPGFLRVAGQYTTTSRQYDLATRGYNEVGANFAPILLSASAGNVDQDNYVAGTPPFPDRVGRVLAPGTAKNVITAGAGESFAGADELGCSSPRHDSINNIWRYSKMRTNVTSGGHPYDTYLKPDLIVPSTSVSSALSAYFSNLGSNCFFFGQSATNRYAILSGTSFSAPAVAGAALIASRVYSPNSAAARPSLLKAMLLATARSMKGGQNYSFGVRNDTVSETILAAPNDVQGFGRLSLDDIVSLSPARQYFNEEYTFTQSGAQWSRSYKVDDSSRPVKIALAWSDLPAVADDARDSTATTTTLLINDLDLQVYTGDGVVCASYWGNNIDTNEESTRYNCSGFSDTKNPVEKVVFSPNAAGVGQFTVVVRATRLGATSCAYSADCLSQPFSLFAYNAVALPDNVLPAPLNSVAPGTTSSRTLTWQAVQGSDHYDIYRGATASTATTKLNAAAITALTYTDSTVTAGTYYVYRICPVDPIGTMGKCAITLASTVATPFTDEALTPLFRIRVAHVTDLRNRVNDFRVAIGMSPAQFSNTIAAGNKVRRADIEELRVALNDARIHIGVPPIVFEDSPINSPATRVRLPHILQLREGLRSR
jgi:hypothetical protein